MSKQFMVKVAEEVNKVFQLGLDPATNKVDQSQKISTNLSDEELLKEILDTVNGSLLERDKEYFSKDTWNWFLKNNVVFGEDTSDSEDELGDVEETVEQETVEQETVEQETVEQETVEQETVEQQKKEKKEKTKKADRRHSKEGNEAFFTRLLKEGKSIEEMTDIAMKELYVGKDSKWVFDRVKTYIRIAKKAN